MTSTKLATNINEPVPNVEMDSGSKAEIELDDKSLVRKLVANSSSSVLPKSKSSSNFQVPSNTPTTTGDDSPTSTSSATNAAQPFSASSLATSNMSSLIYSNPQLATILPLFNLPIMSQLLNGLKSQQQQQQQQMNPKQPDLGLLFNMFNQQQQQQSTVKKAPQQDETNAVDSTPSQPLNLCKDNQSQAKQAPNQTKKLYNSLFNCAQSTTPVLSVNTSSSAKDSKSNGNSTSTPIVFNNASPSPSISSASSSSTSSSTNSKPVASTNQLKLSNATPNVKLYKDLFVASNENATTPTVSGSNLAKTVISTLTPNNSRGENVNNTNNRRQRERTTFDPQEEITRLMQIFEKTHHPTRYQIASICDLLNGLPCRKDKKPLEPYNIQYWFKNARAALRRKLKGDSTGMSSGSTNGGRLNETDDFVSQILNKKSPSLSNLDEFGSGKLGAGANLRNNSELINFNYEDSNFSDFDDDPDQPLESDDVEDNDNDLMSAVARAKHADSRYNSNNDLFNDNQSNSGKLKILCVFVCVWFISKIAWFLPSGFCFFIKLGNF